MKFKIDKIDIWELPSTGEVTLNWGAYGSVSIEHAIAFRDALNAAIEEAIGYRDAREECSCTQWGGPCPSCEKQLPKDN